MRYKCASITFYSILFIFIYSGNMLHYAPENKCTTKIFILAVRKICV